jgi:hypothetical protein
MSCSHVSSCPLFAHFKMKSSLKVWQDVYCNGQYQTCERYKLASSGTRVPPNLLPNGKSLDLALLGLRSAS